MTHVYVEESEGWYYAADVNDPKGGCFGLPATTSVPDDVWRAYQQHRQAERVWHHFWQSLDEESAEP